MQQSEHINELAEALAKAQGAMQNAKKDSTNPHFKSNYADLAAIVSAIRKPLADNDLSYIQTTHMLDDDLLLVTKLAHKSGQWVSSIYPVRPQQVSPQGFGSALTYARRYSLAAIAGMAAEDEDDDGNAASSPHTPVATPKEKKESARARNERWKQIRDELEAAPSPESLKEIWTANYIHIEAFGDLADELHRIKDRKKAEFSQEAMMREGMPPEFNEVG